MTLASPVTDASVRHLAARLELIEARIRVAVARRRATDPDPDDRFRGLYVSDVQVDEMLAGAQAPLLPPAPDAEATARLEAVEADAVAAEAAGVDVRLSRLVRSFALEQLDVELLLVALAPDLDPRFERLYGYLHDDVSRRRASIGLALELVGAGGASGAGRARLGPSGPLVAGGLLVVEDIDRPFLTRALRVPDRVAGHLVGDDTTDPLVAALEVTPSERDLAGAEPLERGLRAGARLAYVRERIGTAPLTLAARALARLGPPPVVVDLGRLGPHEEIGEAATAAIREARLRGAGLVAGPVEVLAERGAAAVRAFAEAGCVTVLHGARGWDPAWSRTVTFLVEAELPTATERRNAWLAALDGSASLKTRSRFFSVSPMYLSTIVERSITYRSRPRDPAMTSADMVLPVPESPAKRAVTPRPLSDVRARPQSSRTRSRWRARAVSSPSCSTTGAGRTRSVQPTRGSIRRASRSRPAAFWDRAPAATSATPRARPDAAAVRRPASAARSTCSGASR